MSGKSTELTDDQKKMRQEIVDLLNELFDAYEEDPGYVRYKNRTVESVGEELCYSKQRFSEIMLPHTRHASKFPELILRLKVYEKCHKHLAKCRENNIELTGQLTTLQADLNLLKQEDQKNKKSIHWPPYRILLLSLALSSVFLLLGFWLRPHLIPFSEKSIIGSNDSISVITPSPISLESEEHISKKEFEAVLDIYLKYLNYRMVTDVLIYAGKWYSDVISDFDIHWENLKKESFRHVVESRGWLKSYNLVAPNGENIVDLIDSAVDRGTMKYLMDNQFDFRKEFVKKKIEFDKIQDTVLKDSEFLQKEARKTIINFWDESENRRQQKKSLLPQPQDSGTPNLEDTMIVTDASRFGYLIQRVGEPTFTNLIEIAWNESQEMREKRRLGQEEAISYKDSVNLLTSFQQAVREQIKSTREAFDQYQAVYREDTVNLAMFINSFLPPEELFIYDADEMLTFSKRDQKPPSLEQGVFSYDENFYSVIDYLLGKVVSKEEFEKVLYRAIIDGQIEVLRANKSCFKYFRETGRICEPSEISCLNDLYSSIQ